MHVLQVQSPHPSPIVSDWSSEDWDGEKAKKREQRSLIDLNFPKLDQKQMMDSDILKELLIQNLNIHDDRKEEEKSPEITDSLVPPPGAGATPKTENTEETEWESIIEEKDTEGLTVSGTKVTKGQRRIFHLLSRNKYYWVVEL